MHCVDWKIRSAVIAVSHKIHRTAPIALILSRSENTESWLRFFSINFVRAISRSEVTSERKTRCTQFPRLLPSVAALLLKSIRSEAKCCRQLSNQSVAFHVGQNERCATSMLLSRYKASPLDEERESDPSLWVLLRKKLHKIKI